MKTLISRPSKKLKTLVDLMGSPRAAALAWDIPVATLSRFLQQGIEAPVPMRIAAKTGLGVDDLTETTEEGR